MGPVDDAVPVPFVSLIWPGRRSATSSVPAVPIRLSDWLSRRVNGGGIVSIEPIVNIEERMEICQVN